MRNKTDWNKWIRASLGRYQLEDGDLAKWMEKKDIPMLNYVLFRGSQDQLKQLLRKANFHNVLLHPRRLHQLVKHANPIIASLARENLWKRTNT